MSNNKKEYSEKLSKDERIKKLSTDPKFREVPKKVKKVKLDDKRFDGMFTNKSFGEKLPYDISWKKG